MIPRTFLVTGASKGIGRALSELLAAAGHHVVGLARSANNDKFPGEFVAVDLGDRKQTAMVLEGLVQRYDFDGVVNNAGLVKPQLGLDDLDDPAHQPASRGTDRAGAAAADEAEVLGPDRQCLQPDNSRHCRAHRLYRRQGRPGLVEWSLPPVDLCAVFPTGRAATAKVRTFVDFFERIFNP